MQRCDVSLGWCHWPGFPLQTDCRHSLVQGDRQGWARSGYTVFSEAAVRAALQGLPDTTTTPPKSTSPRRAREFNFEAGCMRDAPY